MQKVKHHQSTTNQQTITKIQTRSTLQTNNNKQIAESTQESIIQSLKTTIQPKQLIFNQFYFINIIHHKTRNQHYYKSRK